MHVRRLELRAFGIAPLLMRQIAADLGMNPNMLDRWRREHRANGDGTVAFPGNGNARDEELLNLRKALKQAKMERV